MRRAFTIVELMVVVAIIAILTGIVLNVAVGSLRAARVNRTKVLQTTLKTAIETYYAQKGEWPSGLKTLAESRKSNYLVGNAAQEVFRDIVKASMGQGGGVGQLLDPSGLFVTGISAQGKDGRCTGMSFADARQGAHGHKKLGPTQLIFGYPGRKTGKFRPFNIIYHVATDSITVTKCCSHCIKVDDEDPNCVGCSAPPSMDDFVNPNRCKYCHRIEEDEGL